jgi:hypothetical protein
MRAANVDSQNVLHETPQKAIENYELRIKNSGHPLPSPQQ